MTPTGTRRARESNQGPSKKQKKKQKEDDDSGDEELFSEYQCPIGLRLPVDPVVAEDGYCYDRKSIQEWLTKNATPWTSSPMTNKMMGGTLVPSLQTVSAIRRLIDTGILRGARASAWKKERMEFESQIETTSRTFEALVDSARKGDVDSMFKVGMCYKTGSKLFRVDTDQNKAAYWIKRASFSDHRGATLSLAHMYFNGKSGVSKCGPRGIVELARAAMLGCEHSCIIMGMAMHRGVTGGHHADKDAALYWLKRSKLAEHKTQMESLKKNCDELILRLSE